MVAPSAGGRPLRTPKTLDRRPDGADRPQGELVTRSSNELADVLFYLEDA